MTEIILLAKTMNTSSDPIRQFLDGPCDVLNTSVSYEDDPEMLGRLNIKQEWYPPGSEFMTSEHELSPLLLNKKLKETVVIDSMNLWISNLVLLYNSDERSVWVVWERMKEDLAALLYGMRHQLGCKRLIILTSNVDFDWSLRTPVAKTYQRLSWEVDNLLIPKIDRYGLLLNGATLWVQ